MTIAGDAVLGAIDPKLAETWADVMGFGVKAGRPQDGGEGRR
jgi:hypothetical protein